MAAPLTLATLLQTQEAQNTICAFFDSVHNTETAARFAATDPSFLQLLATPPPTDAARLGCTSRVLNSAVSGVCLPSRSAWNDGPHCLRLVFHLRAGGRVNDGDVGSCYTHLRAMRSATGQVRG